MINLSVNYWLSRGVWLVLLSCNGTAGQLTHLWSLLRFGHSPSSLRGKREFLFFTSPLSAAERGQGEILTMGFINYASLVALLLKQVVCK